MIGSGQKHGNKTSRTPSFKRKLRKRKIPTSRSPCTSSSLLKSYGHASIKCHYEYKKPENYQEKTRFRNNVTPIVFVHVQIVEHGVQKAVQSSKRDNPVRRSFRKVQLRMSCACLGFWDTFSSSPSFMHISMKQVCSLCFMGSNFTRIDNFD